MVSFINQVDTANFFKFRNTCGRDFGSYWNQIDEVLQDDIKTVLIIGQGDNIVPLILRSEGLEVSTYDFVEDMQPTYLGDVREIDRQIGTQKFDCILCCEVLEHLPFAEFEKILMKLKNIALKKIIISLPRLGSFVYANLRTSGGRKKDIIIKIPHWLRKPSMCECHYWEINSNGISEKRILNILSEHFIVLKNYKAGTSPYHHFYILTKK